MLGKTFLQRSGQYELLPRRDSFLLDQTSHHMGHSFDYIPKVTENNYTDSSQGCLSWICNLIVISLVYICTFLTFPISGWFVLKTVPNYERIVLFRLGRICPPKGPGVVLLLPVIDQWQRVDLRTRAFNIPPSQVVTKDGTVLSVGADIQFRIWNPVMSVVSVQDLNASTRLTAQNAMMHSLSKKTATEVQAQRLKLGEYLGVDINELTRPWGLEVDRVELTLGTSQRVPEAGPSGSYIAPPSMPGLESLPLPIQELAMHFLGHSGAAQPPQEAEVAISIPGCGEDLLRAVKPLLSEALVSKVGASFQFFIRSDSGQCDGYYLDLSQGGGATGIGSLNREPDVVLTMSDSVLQAMFEGNLQPFAAYTSGRLEVQGNLSAAMRLEEVIKLIKAQSS